MNEYEVEASRIMGEFARRMEAKWRSHPPSSQWQGPIISETKTFAPLTPVRFADESKSKTPQPGILAAILSDFVYVTAEMYPWPDPLGVFGGPFYTTSDLPATVTMNYNGSTVTMNLNAGTYDYYDTNPSTFSFWLSPNAIFGTGVQSWSLFHVVGAEPNIWDIDPGTGNSRLVTQLPNWVHRVGTTTETPGTILDPFLNTYTVNGTDVITRPDNTKGNWAGGKSGGGIWDLRYDLTAYKFRLTSDVGDNNLKTGNQDLPTGTFGANTVA